MTEAGKPTESKVHQVRWDPAEWQRIEEVAAQMSRDQHLDVEPVDVIRSAVRRLCEEKLGPPVAA